MRWGNANPVYNARIAGMPITRSRHLCAFGCLLGLFLLVVESPAARASNWSAGEEQLAAKIAAVTGPGAIAVDFVNRSSLSRTDVDEIRRGLLTELAARGVRFVNAEQATATVRISLSENVRNYVWVAEIHQGTNESSVVMVSQLRPVTTPVEHQAAALVIRKAPLWSQENRILDVAVMDGDPAHMVVLDGNAATIYKLQGSGWIAEQALSIAHSRPWPRDLRGRLVWRKDHLFDAYLPGLFCRSSAAAPLTMNCYESDDPWPIGNQPFSLNGFYAGARNFFTGALAPGVGTQTTAPAFYSAAALPREKYTLWLFDALDGQLHLVDGMTDQILGRLGWGSDIAAVRSGCGSGWQVLATGNGDGSRDTLQAFELPDREPILASQAAEINGAVTALWTDSSGVSATAVVRDSEAARYEAFRITITCGR